MSAIIKGSKPDFPILWDSTMVAALTSCNWKGYLEYFHHWKPKTPNVHLHAGAAFAKGLEEARRTFHLGKANEEEAIAVGVGSLLKAYGNFECPAGSAKTAIRMAGALEYYFEQWPLASDPAQPLWLPGGRPAIEFSFAHPLPVQHPVTREPLIYCGRTDQIVKYGSAGIFVHDDKTTTQLGESWGRQWDLRSQFTGYTWAAYEADIEPQGILVRGVSILKASYGHAEILTYRPKWEIARWMEQLVMKLERAKEAWASGKWEMALDHACTEYGGCTFRQVCKSQDPNPWLETAFERRIWNPLTREESLFAEPLSSAEPSYSD